MKEKRGRIYFRPLLFYSIDPLGIFSPQFGQLITIPLIFLPQFGHLVLLPFLEECLIFTVPWTVSTGGVLIQFSHPLGARLHPIQILVKNIVVPPIGLCPSNIMEG